MLGPLVHAAPATLAAAGGQGWRQVGELLAAFAFSCAIGLERQLRGKAAGLRTQAIVGTTSALVLLVSKYGFGDVLAREEVVLDPSRVVAQVISGVGFLGAGLILTRRGAVRGLTTAAAVWETAAIGIAAGAGLLLLAAVVTALHFVVVFGGTALSRRLPGSRTTAAHLDVTYLDGQGLLRQVLARATRAGWTVTSLSASDPAPVEDDAAGATGTDERRRLVTVRLELAGTGDAGELVEVLGDAPGVRGVAVVDDDELG